MAKRYHYTFGSGMVGCLYDYGPECSPTLRGAIQSLEFVLCDELSARARRTMRGNLRRDGIHYFTAKQRAIVGADYCEVTRHDGPCPDDGEG